ncbi:gamma-glutamylcyclotransferase [Ramlibacter sp.]|uniref:gamma-glutamylcyclotransferase family protein n=1 Tax=Ramlibacter sp. TaxID=1917967 RepID=UPI0035AFDBE8
MPEAPDRLVFVYGTLRRGGRNDINRLQPAPVFVGTASLRGRLYPLGWYPGLLLGGEDAIEVVGEVYRITPPLEARLDEIEEIRPAPDSEYFKRDVAVHVAGHQRACLVYEINPERVRGRPPLAHGDWMAFYAS